MAGALVLAAIVVRVADLQVFGGATYAQIGANQRESVMRLAADRGVVFDRRRVELAISSSRTTVWADPSACASLKDPGLAARLAPVLGITTPAAQAELASKLTGANRFVYLARQLDDDHAGPVNRFIEAEKTAGRGPCISTFREQARVYPNGELARSVIGTTDVDGTGISGVEERFNSMLTGTAGVLEREVDSSRQHTIAFGRTRVVAPTPGNDLVLSLDRSLQYQAEQALLAQASRYGALGGWVVCVDPTTGEIAAMASVSRKSADEPLTVASRNVAVSDIFEPGSIIKPFTLAAALETKLSTPDDLWPTPFRLKVADADFQDFERHPDTKMSLTDILTHSSNTGTINVALKLGRQALYDEFAKFGFGRKTALDLTSEESGKLLDLKKWSATSLPTFAIGQGVAVTPLQVAMAYAAIANGGVLREPRLVTATIDANGMEHPVAVPDGARVLEPAVANQLIAMMSNVVNYGTGKQASVEGYQVAGKTGTAQIPIGGHYVDALGRHHYVSSFVGFAPANNPKLVVVASLSDVLDQGDFQFTGGTIAAPLFSKVMADALRLYQIQPTAMIPGGGGAAPTASTTG